MPRLHPIVSAPLFLGLVLLASQALAADFTGRVVGVSDGDTITVLHNGKGERIRLHGIDCPEKRQAFGNRVPLPVSWTVSDPIQPDLLVVSPGDRRS